MWVWSTWHHIITRLPAVLLTVQHEALNGMLTTPSFMWGSSPYHSNLCQLFRRAAGREHYEAGRTAEALECLKAAAQKDESAITLTNLGMYLTTGIKITTHFCCSKTDPNGQLLYLLANKWITSMAGIYTSENWPIGSSQLIHSVMWTKRKFYTEQVLVLLWTEIWTLYVTSLAASTPLPPSLAYLFQTVRPVGVAESESNAAR